MDPSNDMDENNEARLDASGVKDPFPNKYDHCLLEMHSMAFAVSPLAMRWKIAEGFAQARNAYARTATATDDTTTNKDPNDKNLPLVSSQDVFLALEEKVAALEHNHQPGGPSSPETSSDRSPTTVTNDKNGNSSSSSRFMIPMSVLLSTNDPTEFLQSFRNHQTNNDNNNDATRSMMMQQQQPLDTIQEISHGAIIISSGEQAAQDDNDSTTTPPTTNVTRDDDDDVDDNDDDDK